MTLDEQVEHLGGQRHGGLMTVRRRCGGDHVLGPPGDDLGYAIRQFGRFDLGEFGPQVPGVEPTDLCGECLVEDGVVQPRP